MMSYLFDRYFLVLSGRLSEADCGVLVSPPTPISGELSLDGPLETTLDSTPVVNENDCPLT
jgi:hypothetical protein